MTISSTLAGFFSVSLRRLEDRVSVCLDYRVVTKRAVSGLFADLF